jgi:hypothetical protein
MSEPRLYRHSFEPFPNRNQYPFSFRKKWAMRAFREVCIQGKALVTDTECHIPDDLEEEYIAAKKQRILNLQPDPSDFELRCLRVASLMGSFQCVPKGK